MIREDDPSYAAYSAANSGTGFPYPPVGVVTTASADNYFALPASGATFIGVLQGCVDKGADGQWN